MKYEKMKRNAVDNYEAALDKLEFLQGKMIRIGSSMNSEMVDFIWNFAKELKKLGFIEMSREISAKLDKIRDAARGLIIRGGIRTYEEFKARIKKEMHK